MYHIFELRLTKRTEKEKKQYKKERIETESIRPEKNSILSWKPISIHGYLSIFYNAEELELELELFPWERVWSEKYICPYYQIL